MEQGEKGGGARFVVPLKTKLKDAQNAQLPAQKYVILSFAWIRCYLIYDVFLTIFFPVGTNESTSQ